LDRGGVNDIASGGGSAPNARGRACKSENRAGSKPAFLCLIRSRAHLISVNGAEVFVTSMLVERDAANADKAASKNDLLRTTDGEDA